MARKKTSFYHLRNRIGLNDQRTADILGVSVEEVQRWTLEGAPAMAERFLCLWDSKEVNVDGWQGFRFSRGVLMFKKRRWRPETLIRWSDNVDQLSKLQQDLYRLSTWRGLITAFVDKAVDDSRHYLRRRGF